MEAGVFGQTGVNQDQPQADLIKPRSPNSPFPPFQVYLGEFDLCGSRFHFDRNTCVAHHSGHFVDDLQVGQFVDVGHFMTLRN